MSRTGVVKTKRGKKFAPQVKNAIKKRREHQRKVRARQKRVGKGEQNLSHDEKRELVLQQALATSMNKAVGEGDVEGKSKKRKEREGESGGEGEEGVFPSEFGDAFSDSDGKDEDPESYDDGEEEDDEINEEVAGGDGQELEKSVFQHQKDLEALRTKDPEFFKFLIENDKSLLDFEVGGLEDDEGEDEDEEDEEKEIEGERGNTDLVDMEDEEVAKREILTKEMLESWTKKIDTLFLSQENSKKDCSKKEALDSFNKLLLEYRKCCHVDDAESKNLRTAYSIESSSVFNQVIVYTLRTAVDVFCAQLHIPKEKVVGAVALQRKGEKEKEKSDDGDDEGKPFVPNTNSKRWGKAERAVKTFLRSTMHFLSNIPEEQMARFVLRHVEAYVSFYATIPGLCRRLLQVLVHLWSTSDDENTRIYAFFVIRKLAVTVPYPFIDLVLKKTYQAYVRNAAFVSPTTLWAVQFMKQSLVELCGLDLDSTYNFLFVNIKQLAIKLKNAMNVKSKESYEDVYSWPVLNSLQFFSAVLASLHQHSVIEPMLYPLVQVIFGVLNLIDSPRYFFLKLQCLEMLLGISEETKVYIPLGGQVVLIISRLVSKLTSNDGKFKGRMNEKDSKKMDYRLHYRMSQSMVATKQFQDVTLTSSLSVFLRWAAVHSASVAFPDIMYPLIAQLRRINKKNPNSNWSRRIKVVVEKIEENAKTVDDERNKLEFGPTEFSRTESASKEIATKTTAFVRFVQQQTSRQRPVDMEEQESKQKESVKGKKKQKGSQKRKRETVEKSPPRKRKKSKKITAVEENAPDYVEDLV
eukprot:CAMPEP_0119120978 /NCGR_PEP_ID=MMETSP1310-20130426/1799_1 /TAXON_ID=464262 /ORGANISM="Genus nov. species nov., Strain RCC2339" /LENGTH=805 /DNA_ID=CAMNT_0007110501 /DNA_START=109 /DNA_END=2522 /DNA_ORIENTATION=-